MKRIATFILTLTVGLGMLAQSPCYPFGSRLTWDHLSLSIDGRRVCPVMGEIHYSRVPADEWAAEVRKMREGGVTIIATYVFWNHIEELEGQFDWSGQRDLRRFLQVCKAEGMPVVLRMGPWCHGEARNGGLPDWLFTKGCKVRSQDAAFLTYVTRLYRQIFTQVQGLQWKDGGPVMGAQFDNEYRGPATYLLALKRMATEIGFDLPLYTRTGWPELTTPMPFGEMLPLYGDYADGFWDKQTSEGVGNYYKAFNFRAFRASTAIGTDVLGEQKEGNEEGAAQYPYLTCELGGGMATAYHRRPYVGPEDAYAMALVKLGSGSNLLGYYMYHGGTNPEGKLNTLNECQTSPSTANNDLPVCTYDFQAPLGEFGQPYPQYYGLRPLHLFIQDFGELLATMTPRFCSPQDLKRGEDNALRWSIRTDDRSAFIFVNNYERFAHLTPKKGVRLEVCGVRLPRLNIPAGAMAIFPVNVAGMKYATAQLIARHEGKTYLMQVPGIPVHIALESGKTLRNAKPQGTLKPVCDDIYLLTREEAGQLFLNEFRVPNSEKTAETPIACHKVKEAGALRTIAKGRAKVTEAPSEADWQQAAVYRIALPVTDEGGTRQLLSITYRGDCARLYAIGTDANGSETRRLVADNFYYGRPFLYGLWRRPAGTTALELRVLPLQPEAPIYLPREADRTSGEAVTQVVIRTTI